MREIRFYNTLGRRLETFAPSDPDHVRVYTCGPTVYNHVHIGNLRTFVFEDLLRRSLKFLGYGIEQVMNLTDVDDKTIRGAAAEGVSLGEFTGRYVDSFFEDLDTLRVERAEHYPKATDHTDDMIELVRRLEENGFAYRTEDGSVFFRIAADDDYGRLSGVDPDQSRQGDRVASDEYEKEDVRDFVLWKGAKKGEPSWESPWGDGRPGWHIECSAMAMRYLGESFDVHCGGVDNVFPHHENEIAQSESATGKPFVRTWLHSEHLIVDGQKMSKSLGNQYTLRDLLERGLPPRSVRHLLLSTHYRQKLNFTFEGVDAAGAALKRVDELRFRIAHATERGEGSNVISEAISELREGVEKALADDLNVAEASAALFAFVRTVNRDLADDGLGKGDGERVEAALTEVDRVFGTLIREDWESDDDSGDDAEIDDLVARRQQARSDRDFATADQLRDELTARGIVVEDTPDGPRWKRV